MSKPGGLVCRRCGGSGSCGPVPPCYGTGWAETWGGTWKPSHAVGKTIIDVHRPFYVTGSITIPMVIYDERPNLIGREGQLASGRLVRQP